MAEFYLGQIEFFAFNFPPKGWAQCRGQLLPINQNHALFAVIGTTYGGDGQTSFALPNLQGRIVAGPGSGITRGAAAGEETHQLATTEMPTHTHVLNGDGQTAASSNVSAPAASTVLGSTVDLQTSQPVNVYASGSSNGQMAAQSIGTSGSGTPHENRMPYIVVNACIALTGLYPSRA